MDDEKIAAYYHGPAKTFFHSFNRLISDPFEQLCFLCSCEFVDRVYSSAKLGLSFTPRLQPGDRQTIGGPTQPFQRLLPNPNGKTVETVRHIQGHCHHRAEATV